jgi:hypothetical protein
MPYHFADYLDPIQGPYRRQDMCRVGALAASGFDQLAVSSPREQYVEEQRLRRPGQQARAKFAEHRGIEPRIRELQVQHIFPVDATLHRMGRLAIGQPFRELKHRGERQPPRWLSGVSVGGEERSKGVIREQRIDFIGESQISVPLGKRGRGDTHRFVKY